MMMSFEPALAKTSGSRTDMTPVSATEVVNLAALKAYDPADQFKLSKIWQEFRNNYKLNADGEFELSQGGNFCPDTKEAQTAFLHYIKSNQTELTVHEQIRCGECSGTGRIPGPHSTYYTNPYTGYRYYDSGYYPYDYYRYTAPLPTYTLDQTAIAHTRCGGTGKIEAIIIYKLTYSGEPPQRAPKPAQGHFMQLMAKAKAGDSSSYLELAECYATGAGTKQDARSAVEWYAKKALTKDFKAAALLARMYEAGGQGLVQDRPMSIALDIVSQRLGSETAYEQMIGKNYGPKEFLTGRWFAKKILKELQSGTPHEAIFTSEGVDGVIRDEVAESIKYPDRLIAKNSYEIGMRQLTGNHAGLPDLSAAYGSFIEAARRGQADGLQCLGLFSEKGLHVPQNRSAAFVFYSLANSLGADETDAMAIRSIEQKYRTPAARELYLRLLKVFRASAQTLADFDAVSSLEEG